jgi:hypothetical protein
VLLVIQSLSAIYVSTILLVGGWTLCHPPRSKSWTIWRFPSNAITVDFYHVLPVYQAVSCRFRQIPRRYHLISEKKLLIIACVNPPMKEMGCFDY